MKDLILITIRLLVLNIIEN